MTTIIVIGSNIGDRIAYILSAIGKISQICQIVRISRLYLSKPFGYEKQGDFINTALGLRVDLSPKELLFSIKAIEADLGRKRNFPNGPRVIDIDIALWGDLIVESGELTIPHKALAERDFFIVPIAEIAPDAIEPRSGKTMSKLRDEFPVDQGMIISHYEDKRWQTLTT